MVDMKFWTSSLPLTHITMNMFWLIFCLCFVFVWFSALQIQPKLLYMLAKLSPSYSPSPSKNTLNKRHPQKSSSSKENLFGGKFAFSFILFCLSSFNTSGFWLSNRSFPTHLKVTFTCFRLWPFALFLFAWGWKVVILGGGFCIFACLLASDKVSLCSPVWLRSLASPDSDSEH